MLAKSKNKKKYFQNELGKKTAQFKLWIFFKKEYEHKYPNNPFCFYGFNKLPKKGEESLLRLAIIKRNEYKMARLFNNQTGKQIVKIYGNTSKN